MVVIMTEISGADFLKLSVNEVSDLLLEKISDDKTCSYALLEGKCSDGKQYRLCVKLELVE